MSLENFSFKVAPTNPLVPLTLSLWINDKCVVAPTVINEEKTFTAEIDDDIEQEHAVRIEMSGKTDEHTKIDEHGNIVEDALLKFSSIELMEIGIDNIFINGQHYRHNHNGHSDEVVQQFALTMGCNGSVEFTFTTPIYMWLLEHL